MMARVLLFCILMGIMGLAVDIGYVVAVRYEILNVEDAAALAAALQRSQVPDGWDTWGRPNHWFAEIDEARAKQKAMEAFQKNTSEKPILSHVAMIRIQYAKMSRNRFKISIDASVQLPLTTKFFRSLGVPAPAPWPIHAESVGGFD